MGIMKDDIFKATVKKHAIKVFVLKFLAEDANLLREEWFMEIENKFIKIYKIGLRFGQIFLFVLSILWLIPFIPLSKLFCCKLSLNFLIILLSSILCMAFTTSFPFSTFSRSFSPLAY